MTSITLKPLPFRKSPEMENSGVDVTWETSAIVVSPKHIQIRTEDLGGGTPVLHEADYPLLAQLWDNEEDAAYDVL